MSLPQYEVTDRFVLHAGYACNARCAFCYYLEDLRRGTARNFTTGQNKRKISFAYALGKRAIDISGGEPTIRRDLPELIGFSRKKGYRTVTIITNGIATSDAAYCARLKNSGLTEALFSIHSHDAAIHDSLTGITGSYKKIMQSIENFSALGMPIRINTVITASNYSRIELFLASVHALQPATVNLIVFNPSETAVHVEKDSPVRFSDYRGIGEALSDALDVWKDRFRILNVRFLPFCFLRKHPDAVRTQWQKFHEAQEWDPFLNVLFQKGSLKALAALSAGSLCPRNTPKFGFKRFDTLLSKLLSDFRIKYYYRQNEECRQCDVRSICTGFQKDYVKKFGFPGNTRISLEDARVTDPLYFVKQPKYRPIFPSM